MWNKYGVSNKLERTIDGITFASKAEMNRYCELKLLIKAHEITDLEFQPKFDLIPKFEVDGKKYRKISYSADFKYFDITKDKIVIEDVKGFETPVFKLKKKLFLYKYRRNNEDFEFVLVK